MGDSLRSSEVDLQYSRSCDLAQGPASIARNTCEIVCLALSSRLVTGVEGFANALGRSGPRLMECRQHLEHFSYIDRLGHVIIHSRIQCLLPITHHGVGGHGENGKLGKS